MALIPLSRGLFAIVDDVDVALVGQYKWCAIQSTGGRRCFYAVCPMTKSRPKLIMHRLIAGTPPGLDTDHVNGDGLDNRRANLRHATRSQNSANSWNQRNKTGFRGVSASFKASKWPWLATITVRGQYHWIGYFETAEAAARAYDAKAIELQGEFARLNFPQVREAA